MVTKPNFPADGQAPQPIPTYYGEAPQQYPYGNNEGERYPNQQAPPNNQRYPSYAQQYPYTPGSGPNQAPPLPGQEYPVPHHAGLSEQYYGGQAGYAQQQQQQQQQQQPFYPQQQQQQYPPNSGPSSGYDRPPPSYYGQDQSGPPLTSLQQEAKPQPTEEDRGIMGALAGAAAGGYAGHKMHHGVLGTLGGAYAGHKLEDAYKEHHKKPSPSASPQPPSQQHQQYQAPNTPPPGYDAPVHAGNFSASCNNISLDADYDLIASCRTVNGETKLSAISLNRVLTNDDGRFAWMPTHSAGHGEGGNFGASARNVRLEDGGRTLRGELKNCRGEWRDAVCQLNERIGNSNGDLVLV